MTPGAALRLEPPGPARSVRWLVFLTCAAALFVFAYGSATTWAEVQRAIGEGFGARLDEVVQGNAAGNRYRQLAAIALGLLGAWGMASRRRAAALGPVGALGGLLAAYVALSFLSIAWADEPGLAVRRGLAFGLFLIAVLGLARALPREAIVSFALFGSAAYVLVALAVEGGSGAFDPLGAGYRLSGVFHPNTTGAFAAVLVMAAACTEPRRVRPWLLAAAIALGAVVVLLTRSRSALLGLGIALSIRWLAAARPSRGVFALVVGAWLACAGALVFGQAGVDAARDALLSSREDSELETLSGRTALWDALLGYAAQRPVLGYGFGSFWDTERIQELFATQRWPVTEAHSTYLQQLLDLGVIGLTLYLLLIVAASWRAVRRLRATGDRAYAFMLCVLAYFLVVGALETMHPNPGFLSFLFLWTLASLGFRDSPAVEGSTRCAST